MQILKVIRSIIISLSIAWAIFSTQHASAAVTVSSFSAQRQATQIAVNWSTASEINNVGFNLYRSTSAGQRRDAKINASVIPSQCLGCIAGASYSFTDTGAGSSQTVYYTLESVDASSSTQLFGPASATASATATMTPIPATATRTATPSLVPASSTPTATQPSTATRTLLPGTRTPTRAAASSTPLPSPTLSSTPPRTKVAVAAPIFTPTPVVPIAGARAVPTAQPSPELRAAQAAPANFDAEPEPDGNQVPESNGSESPARDEALHRLTTVASLSLAGLFALASFISGAFAFMLLVRASRR